MKKRKNRRKGHESWIKKQDWQNRLLNNECNNNNLIKKEI